MADNGNPFNTPLPSQVSNGSGATPLPSQTNSDNGNPFNTPLPSQQAEEQRQQSGEITNDVGNTVIVPKKGESFADTMKRAAAYGKTVTQDQINKELATAPRKAAETLVAAPVIGAGGAAALAAPGEVASAGGRVIQMTEAALHEYAEAHPLLVKLAAHLGIEGTKAFGLYQLLKSVAGSKK